VITYHFWHSDIDMTSISLMHSRATKHLEQITKDMIRRFRAHATTLRALW